ncbi:hypothetical protein BO94DRAFT_1971 [Aspergillus sclerotioniger CBS 115572]|uniref:Uncharacterized protein n=1 Tax=Aspergillus sclerotioniger CBS 115572 TaxID=1450535 RepID=A0A317XC14_9EURO|nr:hypothetical protein BO94DRAFT_1971 [Aspergillus sclerotioniger CBS 115572]PWY96184.1 hypothetical protein BO94DRAFT_1971 [Aspergillus sclerotioniger CBS 115572]
MLHLAAPPLTTPRCLAMHTDNLPGLIPPGCTPLPTFCRLKGNRPGSQSIRDRSAVDSIPTHPVVRPVVANSYHPGLDTIYLRY